MKHIFFLFLLLISSTSFAQKKEYPPIIQDKVPFKIMYSDIAQYTYTLDTRKINILKPNTAYLKILTFEGEKKAIMETVYNTEEVQLIDHNLSQTTIKQKREEITYSVLINNDKITLINPKTKQKIYLIASGSYDDLVLENTKTPEIFDNQNPMTKERMKHQPPLYKP